MRFAAGATSILCVIDCVRLCVQGTGYFYGLTSKLLDAALPFQTINLTGAGHGCVGDRRFRQVRILW